MDEETAPQPGKQTRQGMPGRKLTRAKQVSVKVISHEAVRKQIPPAQFINKKLAFGPRNSLDSPLNTRISTKLLLGRSEVVPHKDDQKHGETNEQGYAVS